MSQPHNPADMKAYLLGLLDDPRMRLLEEQYFIDRAVLTELRRTEQQLIRSYLNRALSPSETSAFEAKYLADPALRTLVDQARRTTPRPWPTRPVLALAATLVITLAGTLTVISRRDSAVPEVPPAAVPPSPQPRTLSLNPGVAKGPSESVSLAPSPQPVNLVLNQTGAPNGQATVVVSRVSDSGVFEPVWTGTGVSSRDAVQVTVPGDLLLRGDYVAEVTIAGQVREKYLFRVAPLP